MQAVGPDIQTGRERGRFSSKQRNGCICNTANRGTDAYAGAICNRDNSLHSHAGERCTSPIMGGGFSHNMPDHLLKEFKGLFPAELPNYVSPDRGLGDLHAIPVNPGTEPISRKMYCHSPKEQLLIK